MAIDSLSKDIVGDSPKSKRASLPDLNWLNVDPASYRMHDTLPKQNLDIAPDLKAIWDHSPEGGFHLVPNQDRMTTNASDIDKTAMDLSEGQKVQLMVGYAKRAMIGGLTGDALRKAIQGKFDSVTIASGAPKLKKLLSDQGLFGNVYITSDVLHGRGKAASEAIIRKLPADVLVVNDGCAKCAGLKEDRYLPFKVVDRMVWGRRLASKHLDKLHAAGRAPSIKLPDTKVASGEAYRMVLQQAYLWTPPKVAAESPKVIEDANAQAKRQVVAQKQPKIVKVDHRRRQAKENLGQIRKVMASLVSEGVFTKAETSGFESRLAGLVKDKPDMVGKPFLGWLEKQANLRRAKARDYTGAPNEQSRSQNKRADLTTTVDPREFARAVQSKEIKPLTDFILREMYAGHTGDELKSRIAKNFSTEYIAKHARTIKAYVAQQGLLGKVYIMSNPFKTAGDLSLHLKKHGSTAKYVLAAGETCFACRVPHPTMKCAALGLDLFDGDITEKVARKVIAGIRFNNRLSDNQLLSLRGLSPKEMVRKAMLMDPPSRPPAKYAGVGTQLKEPVRFEKAGIDAKRLKKEAEARKAEARKKLAARIEKFAVNGVAGGLAGNALKVAMIEEFGMEALKANADVLAGALAKATGSAKKVASAAVADFVKGKGVGLDVMQRLANRPDSTEGFHDGPTVVDEWELDQDIDVEIDDEMEIDLLDDDFDLGGGMVIE